MCRRNMVSYRQLKDIDFGVIYKVSIHSCKFVKHVLYLSIYKYIAVYSTMGPPRGTEAARQDHVDVVRFCR